MNNRTIENYRRISKAAARKLYNSGATIRFTACNISPVNVWSMYADFNHETTKDYYKNDFDFLVQYFTIYNCSNEVGYYPAYYIKEV